MNSFTDFTGEVQHRIEAPSQAEAVQTTRAVLETLGERIDEGEATDLASPLPQEIDRYLLQVEHRQDFGFDGFVDRVVDRIDYSDLDLRESYGRPSSVDRAEAVYRIQAVVALLGEIAPGSELDNVEDQLPDEFDDLFDFVDAEEVPWQTEEAEAEE